MNFKFKVTEESFGTIASGSIVRLTVTRRDGTTSASEATVSLPKSPIGCTATFVASVTAGAGTLGGVDSGGTRPKPKPVMHAI